MEQNKYCIQDSKEMSPNILTTDYFLELKLQMIFIVLLLFCVWILIIMYIILIITFFVEKKRNTVCNTIIYL